MKKTLLLGLLGALALNATAAPTVKIRLPERFRLLTDQRFDLRIEATTLTDTNAIVQIVINGVDGIALDDIEELVGFTRWLPM